MDPRYDLLNAGRAKQSGRCRIVKPSVIRRTVSLACHSPYWLTRLVSLSLNDVPPSLRYGAPLAMRSKKITEPAAT